MHVCMRAKSLQWCLTLCDPIDSSPPGSSVHGISLARYWSGLPFPSLRDLPNPGIETAFLMSLALGCWFLTTSAAWEAQAFLMGIWKRESIKVDGTRVDGTCLSAVGLYIGHCCRLVAK